MALLYLANRQVRIKTIWEPGGHEVVMYSITFLLAGYRNRTRSRGSVRITHVIGTNPSHPAIYAPTRCFLLRLSPDRFIAPLNSCRSLTNRTIPLPSQS